MWEKAFPHPGTQGFANAATVLANGDVVITGAFDLELDFGGDTDPLTSTATLSGIPNGFVARFTPDGAPVWAAHFGGDDFSDGTIRRRFRRPRRSSRAFPARARRRG